MWTELAALAVFVSAVAGAVLGTAGFLEARRKDSTAAKTTAADVATKAVDSAVGVLNDALDYLRREVAELRVRVDRCEDEKAEIREHHARCDEERAELRRLLDARG